MARTIALKCPNCGSAEVSKQSTDQFRCGHCESVFVPSETDEPPKRGGSRAPQVLVFGVAGFLLLVGGAMALWLMAGGGDPGDGIASRPSATRTYKGVAPKTVQAKRTPPVEPKVELAHLASGKTSIGGLFWIAICKNTGEVSIGNASIEVTLFDAEGSRIVAQKGYAARKLLPPGASTPILALVNEPPSSFAKSEVVMSPPRPAQRFTRETGLTVKDFRETPGVGTFKKIVGTLVNENEVGVRFAKVIIVGKSKDGKPVSFASGMPLRSALAKGEESGFGITIGVFQIEPPVTYEVFAIAQPAAGQ